MLFYIHVDDVNCSLRTLNQQSVQHFTTLWEFAYNVKIATTYFWCNKIGDFVLVKTNQPCAPDWLMQFLHCNCKLFFKSPEEQEYADNGLSCVKACRDNERRFLKIFDDSYEKKKATTGNLWLIWSNLIRRKHSFSLFLRGTYDV